MEENACLFVKNSTFADKKLQNTLILLGLQDKNTLVLVK